MNVFKNLGVKSNITSEFERYQKHSSSQKTDAERIKFTLNLLEKYKISPTVDNEGKSVSKCKEFNEQANKLYGSLKPTSPTTPLNQIIETYTKSVAYAPLESQELSIAYANRSAVLYTARLYEDGLRDIERALKLNYPDNLRAKLLSRKARCLIALKRPGSDEAIEEARQWLDKLEMTNPHRKVIEKTLTGAKLLKIDKPRLLLDDKRNLPESPDSVIPSASSAVHVNYSEEYGRHIVATRDIKPGELLLIEHSYAAVVEIDKRYTFCGNCMKATWSAIPCDHCVNVIYCTESCRETAWTDHHDVECQIIGALIAQDVSLSGMMALRLTVKALKEVDSPQALKEQFQSIDSSTESYTGEFIENPFNKAQHANIYTLQRNFAPNPMFEVISFVESAVLLYHLATKTNIFGDKFDGDLTRLCENEWVEFVGGLLLRNINIAETNMRSVVELDDDRKPISRGPSIAPFTSLLNHSCCPNTGGCFYGMDHAIYSTQLIKKGEQIFDCYNTQHANYSYVPKKKRQAYLQSRYNFTCNCVACTEFWPLLKDIPSFTIALSMPRQVKMQMMMTFFIFESYRYRVYALDIENAPEVIVAIVELSKIFGNLINVPCKENCEVSNLLATIYAVLANRRQILN